MDRVAARLTLILLRLNNPPPLYIQFANRPAIKTDKDGMHRLFNLCVRVINFICGCPSRLENVAVATGMARQMSGWQAGLFWDIATHTNIGSTVCLIMKVKLHTVGVGGLERQQAA